MRCHQCNQDSIKIVMDDDIIHIKCDICALDINCGENNPLLCELFLYNEQLEDSEGLGKEALIGSKELKDNPYSLNSNQIILNKRWELGYKREKESYEFSALSLSSEKIEDQLKTDIKVLKEDLNKKYELLLSKYEVLFSKIKELDNSKYLLGMTYRQELSLILKEIPGE